jgi:uncharacterized membrane protein YbhN (UPF0104 family)
MMFPNISTTVVMPVAVSVIIALAVAAPSAPGFIGIYQVGCIGALRLYEVSNDQAVAFALVSHLVQYLTVLLFGLVCLRRQGIRWRELRERVEDNESPLDLLK